LPSTLTRRERPRRRAAEQRDERAPPHGAQRATNIIFASLAIRLPVERLEPESGKLHFEASAVPLCFCARHFDAKLFSL